jgi:LCP family protein required for cell wall assembly
MAHDTSTQTDEPGAPERTQAAPPLRPHPHLRRVFLGVTATASAFVMVIAAVSMGTYFWARGQIHVIPPVQGPGQGSATTEDIAGKCAERACNYLLLGSDSRKGLSPEEIAAFGSNAHIGGENRSDTIMLVHTRPDRKEATFLSFPRDLWVDIPGMGMGKINSAFEGGIDGGGAQRVARTVKSISGMQIHHVMYVNLLGFQKVVDALGGVDMCVPYPMYDPLTLLDIQAGCQHFDGRTALAYVRTRHQPCDTVPDFARISRQQQFLRAVIAKLLQPGELLKLQNLVPELLGNLVVDQGLNPAELVYLAGLLHGVGTDNADFRALPTVPEGIYD